MNEEPHELQEVEIHSGMSQMVSIEVEGHEGLEEHTQCWPLRPSMAQILQVSHSIITVPFKPFSLEKQRNSSCLLFILCA